MSEIVKKENVKLVQEKCPRCKGRGRLGNNKPCKKCNGKGYVEKTVNEI